MHRVPLFGWLFPSSISWTMTKEEMPKDDFVIAGGVGDGEWHDKATVIGLIRGRSMWNQYTCNQQEH